MIPRRGSLRQLVEILAVVRLLGIIAIVRIAEPDAALNAVHPAEAAAIRVQHDNGGRPHSRRDTT